MNYKVYLIYVDLKRMIEKAESCPNDHGDEEINLVSSMKITKELLEETYPEYAVRYEREQGIFASFTPEQRDFICSQIGWWYLLWKGNMATGEGTQHRLGVAKEGLKTMICGE